MARRRGTSEDFNHLFSQLEDLKHINDNVSRINSRVDSLITTPITITPSRSIANTPYFRSMRDINKGMYSELKIINKTNKETSSYLSGIDSSLRKLTAIATGSTSGSVGSFSQDQVLSITNGLDEVVDAINKQSKILRNTIEDNAPDPSPLPDPSPNPGGNTSGWKSMLSKAGSWLGSAFIGVVGSGINTLSTRAVNDIKNMIEARNDIMYERGVSAAEADQLYRLQFQHKAMPYMRHSAPEQRELRRDATRSALDAGFTTIGQINTATDKLYEYKELFPQIDLESKKFFTNTIKYLDSSGSMVDNIMSKIRQASTDLMVTPEQLANVTDGYTKYFRFVTRSNNAFTKSMTGVIDTVARLEDAQIDSEGILGELQDFSLSSLGSASGQEMWTKLSMMGINPMDVREKYMSGDVAGATMDYTKGLKDYFNKLGYNENSGIDERFLILADQLGFNNSTEVGQLMDVIQGNFENNATKAKGTGVDDYTKKVELDADAYYDKATAGWTYLTESQKFQDAITDKILSNELLVNGYEKWEEMTKGIFELDDAIRGISSYILGGSLLRGIGNVFRGLFGGGSGTGAGGGGPGPIPSGGGAGAGIWNTLRTGLGRGGINAGGAASTVAKVAGVTGLVGGGLWAAHDAYQGVGLSEQWLGQERGSSLSGKVSSGVGGALGGTGPGIMDEGSGWDKAGNVLGNAGKGALIGAGIGSFIPVIGTAIGGLIGGGIGAIGGAIGGENIANGIKTAWDATKNFAIDTWDTVSTKAGEVWDGVKNFGIDAFNTAVGAGDMAMDSLFETMGLDWGQFKDDMAQGWEDFKQWGSDAWTNVKTWASDTWTSVSEGAANLWSGFKDLASGAWDSIKTGFSNAVDAVSDWYEDSWLKKGVDGVTGWASDTWNSAKNWASNAWNSVTGWFGSAKERGESITGVKSHFNGLNYVPYDNYAAYLHKGERVLTRSENEQYTRSLKESANLTNNLVESNNDLDKTNIKSNLLATDTNKEFGKLNTSLNYNNPKGLVSNIVGLQSANSTLNTTLKGFDRTTTQSTKSVGLLTTATNNIKTFLSDLFVKDTKTGKFMLNVAGVVGDNAGGPVGPSDAYDPFTGKYRVTSPYGWRIHPISKTRKFHSGTDFGIGANTPLPALDSGTITASKWGGGYGNMVDLLGDNGYAYRYAHLNTRAFKVGDKVNRGDIIGKSGSTGNSTGPHLHLEVRNPNGELMDPIDYFKNGVKTTASTTSSIFELFKSMLGLSTSSGSAGNGGSAEANAKLVYKSLSKFGLSKTQIAGVLGNWTVESGIDPTTIEGYYKDKYTMSSKKMSMNSDLSSYTLNTLFPLYARSGVSINKKAYKGSDGKYYPGLGLGQFTGPAGQSLISWAKKMGLNWYDLDAQIDYMTKPGGYRYDWLNKWKNSSESSPESAAETFLRKWEGIMNGTLGKRQKSARSYYDQMKNWGSYEVGLGRVPYDGFPAVLHKDETILSAAEAEFYRQNNESALAVLSKGNIGSSGSITYVDQDGVVSAIEILTGVVREFYNLFKRTEVRQEATPSRTSNLITDLV